MPINSLNQKSRTRRISSNFLLFNSINVVSEKLNHEMSIVIVGLGYGVGQILVIFFDLRRKKWLAVVWYNIAMVAALGVIAGLKGILSGISLGLGAVTGTWIEKVSYVFGAMVGGAVMTPSKIVLAAIGNSAVVAILLATGAAGAEVSGTALLVAFHLSYAFAVSLLLAGSKAALGFAVTLCYLLLSIYLSQRALKQEEPMLMLLRRYALLWRSWGGTNFSHAVLGATDFSQADVTSARFTKATFSRCLFRESKNLHLAFTYKTILEPLPVRQLLATGQIQQKDFSNYNLRGVNFANLDLQDCNFYHADLSEADLSGCNLSKANLCEAMALGTLFNNTTLTAANIDNWSIDKQTQFDGVACDFVYVKRDQSERNPPQGQFKAGEFSKLYQEIANTVDFIAHSPDELQALLRAIEKIKAEGAGIFIQQMERKTDSVVIRVQSENNIELDKAAIYAEVNKQKEVELKALEADYKHKLLEQKLEHLEREGQLKDKNQDLLADIAKLAVQNHTTQQFNIGDNPIMQNDNRQANNNTDSMVNLGDNSTQKQHSDNVTLTVSSDQRQAISSVLEELLKHKGNLPDDMLEAVYDVRKVVKVDAEKPTEKTQSLLNKLWDGLKEVGDFGTDVADIGKFVIENQTAIGTAVMTVAGLLGYS